MKYNLHYDDVWGGFVRLPHCTTTYHRVEVLLTARAEGLFESRLENPQKMTQLSPRSHPRHLVGKKQHKKTPS